MIIIEKVFGREILDSRGNPTVEAEITLSDGTMERSIVPSGASTGSKEALELRDKDDRYHGLGVLKAVKNINDILAPSLIGMDVTEQEKIDRLMLELDGTPNKERLGANAILAVSLSVLKAAAKSSNKGVFEYLPGKKSIPYPMMNIINGGSHADNNLDFQEFMILPQQTTIRERVRCGSEIFHTLKKILKDKRLSTAVGDEGGFAPNLESNRSALEFIVMAISHSGYTPRKDVYIGLDVAASEFYNKITKRYEIKGENLQLTSVELTDYLCDLVENFPIISIEDSHDENDYPGFSDITKRLGGKIQLVGDDLFVTNKKIFTDGIINHLCNSILIKPNQIGTYTEMKETIDLAVKYGYNTIISHRSGDSEDTIIADLAVGLNLGQIKTGSLSRSERVSKYNQLIRIDEVLNNELKNN